MLATRTTPFQDVFTAFDRDLTAMERQMFQTLQRLFGDTEVGTGSSLVTWRPRSEMYRDGDHLVINLELPGIDPEKDVEIDIENGMLHIHGERKFDREIHEGDRYLAEFAYGSFSRWFQLPEGVDADSIEAGYHDGILTIRVPLPSGVAAKRIPVKVGKGLGWSKK